MLERYPFPVPARPSVAIADSAERFPVHRIYCVGRNYAAHVREMGSDPAREPPVFFTKPADAVVEDGAEIDYAARTRELHHEIELVVALARGGADIAVAKALDCVFGYAVGIDLTRRDLQAQARRAGQPWDIAKAFDRSAPVSAIVPAARSAHPAAGAIWLEVNGERRQQADLSEMLWSVAEIIAELSTLFELAAGDLIFTGTPAGVGPVRPGDRIAGGIDGVGRLALRVRGKA